MIGIGNYRIIDKNRIQNETRELVLRAQNELWNCKFWHNLFYEVNNKHNYQNEFYLVGSNPSQQEVEIYLHSVFKRLRSRYKITCRRQTASQEIIFELGLSYLPSIPKKKQCIVRNEILVQIGKTEIFLSILPYSTLGGVYRLDEYLIVEHVIEDFCNEVFTHPDESFTTFLEYKKKLEETSKTLNEKALEIAQNSIRSLYETSTRKNRNLIQELLYSSLIIDGKENIILHIDFLKNPEPFIKLFRAN